MEAISYYSFSMFDFLQNAWNVGQEGWNYKNLNMSRDKTVFHEIKVFFIIFVGFFVGEI